MLHSLNRSSRQPFSPKKATTNVCLAFCIYPSSLPHSHTEPAHGVEGLRELLCKGVFDTIIIIHSFSDCLFQFINYILHRHFNKFYFCKLLCGSIVSLIGSSVAAVAPAAFVVVAPSAVSLAPVDSSGAASVPATSTAVGPFSHPVGDSWCFLSPALSGTVSR